jgi:hypothetical protein
MCPEFLYLIAVSVLLATEEASIPAAYQRAQPDYAPRGAAGKNRTA